MDLHQSSSVGEDEFHFWSSNRRFRNHHGDGVLGSYKPPRSLSDNSQKTLSSSSSSSSSLLPWNHHYSNGSLSPSSRTRQIEQGRKELMEMIRNLPETSFELSLKDIVDDVKNPEEATEEQKKKAKNVPSQVLRRHSMDSGVSLIKMFLPSCLLSSNKKLKKHLGPSVISPRTSVNAVDKHSWIKNSPIQEELSSKSCRSSRGRICSFCSSCRKASVKSNPRCWPFEMVKSRMRRQKSCSFS